MGYLEDLVNVSISRTSRTPTLANFGTPLILAYHALYLARVREYDDLDEMLEDGFTVYDPAYQMAAAIFAQEIGPPSVKVGRRALPFTQVVNLTPAAPVSASTAETYTVKVYGLTATFTSDATPTIGEVRTGVAAAINALGDADAIIATGASSGSLQSLDVDDLDGVVGDAAMTPPRMLSFTFSSHADWDTTTITVTGTDANGDALSETFAVPNGGAATVNGTKRFRTVTAVSIPAQGGTGGTFTMGTRAPVSAAVVSSDVVCTSVAGQLNSFELITDNFTMTDATTDPGIATDLAAVFSADADWYVLLLDSNSQAEVSTATTGAAAWTEANKRLLLVQSPDAEILNPASTTDMGYVLSAAGYLRTAWDYYPSIGVYWKAAAWAGEELPKTPGSSTWALKTLVGIPAYELTSTERAAVEAKNGNHYLTAGGVAITNPGKVAGDEWIDVVRDLDWLASTLTTDVFAVELANDKIPFTDNGISLILAAVRARLTTAVENTVLADDPAPTVTAPRAAAVSTANRQARHLPDVRFTGRMAGAIHTLNISGRVAA